MTTTITTTKNGASFLLVLFLLVVSCTGWEQCSEEAGGGICPDRATCCPTTTRGVSGCISAKAKDPSGMARCCDDRSTGCGYGYTCAKEENDDESNQGHNSLFCKLQDNSDHDPENFDSPRYQLCSVPTEYQKLHGFPMMTEEDNTNRFRLAYYSNMDSVTVPQNRHLRVETVLIMIHGSARNADDYFCAALSVMALDNKNKKNATNSDTVLVLAPKFAAPEDEPSLDNALVWVDHDENIPLSHTWRYGADAMNAPISSFAALDSLVEYLVQAKVQYPNLRRIVVAGHSAGGQITQRWALLSNSPAWETIDVRAVVANPRSYSYLDGRRIAADGTTFEVPDEDDIAFCEDYNKWTWGLEPGGRLVCPYKDNALKITPADTMTERYATRKVIYLAGEHDTISLFDACETSNFQGENRNERAKNFVQGLKEYFGRPVHALHIVPGSPHDHSLMFQSEAGQRAIFGDDKFKGSERNF